VGRPYLLLEDQGVTAIIVEGGGDHIYDWQSGEKETVKNQS
jgi:hypothetical protein